MKYEKHYYEGHNTGLQYCEIPNNLKPLVLLHAQAVDSSSFFNVMPELAHHFHVYAVDCYGHGGSLHEASKYNIADMGNAVIDFIKNVVKEPASGTFLRRTDCSLHSSARRPLQRSGA